MTEPWITEPGEYDDLTDAEYHADPVVGGSLTSTGARTLINASPARYRYDLEHGRADKPHFDEGRAAHSLVLGVGAALYVPVSGDLDEDGRPIPYKEWRTDDAKAQVKAARDRADIPVKPDVAKRVAAMAARLAEHPYAGPLLARPGWAEQTVVARDPDTNVTCRIRIDFRPKVEPGQRQLIVDYKGTTSAGRVAFARRCADLGYDQQGAFYSDVLTWWLDLDIPPAVILIAQEKEPPYLVSVNELRPDDLAGARELNRDALEIYRRCRDLNDWPGYDPEPAYLDLPGWRTAAYEAAYERRQRRRDLIGALA